MFHGYSICKIKLVQKGILIRATECNKYFVQKLWLFDLAPFFKKEEWNVSQDLAFQKPLSGADGQHSGQSEIPHRDLRLPAAPRRRLGRADSPGRKN